MKKLIRKIKNEDGFTLIEMLIVLFVIAVLILLFVPSLSKQTVNINKQGNEALTKVIDTQVEMYRLDTGKSPNSLKDLYEGKYITKEQQDKAAEIGYTLPGDD